MNNIPDWHKEFRQEFKEDIKTLGEKIAKLERNLYLMVGGVAIFGFLITNHDFTKNLFNYQDHEAQKSVAVINKSNFFDRNDYVFH